MQREQSLAAQADAFIEENRELLQDPETSSIVLGRILQQGAAMAPGLDEEANAVADPAVEAAEALEAAIYDQSVSPKELKQLETTHKERKAEFDAPKDALTRLVAFLEDVREFYEFGGDEDGVEDVKESNIQGLEPSLHSEEPPFPRIESRQPELSLLWKRFFG